MKIKRLWSGISRQKHKGRPMGCKRSRNSWLLSTNIRTKLIPTKLLWGELIVYKDTLKPRMNKNISQLAQSRTTKTLLWQLSIIYPLGTQGLAYLIIYHIVFLKDLIYIYKLLPVVGGDFLFITPILYLLLNILALLPY